MNDALEEKVYGIAETGRMLGIPGSTVRRWITGWRSGGKEQPPILEAVDGLLSFQDLAELSVVQQLRGHKIDVKTIREGAQLVRDIHRVDRPFLQGVLVDVQARDLLVDYLKRMISTKTRDQAVIDETAATRLIRPERISIDDGLAVRVFPYSRENPDADPKMVAIDPRYRFGRPVTSPSLIEIEGIATRILWGEDFREIADFLEPSMGVPELEEGLRYWIKTMTRGPRRRLDDIADRRIIAFQAGLSAEAIAKHDGVRTSTVVKSLSEALEAALAA